MNDEVIITCAVTGAGDTAGVHPDLPVTPRQIAEAALEAARAGAAVAHIHVRDPQTGAPSRKLEYYREVVERIRESSTDVIINLTTGMGGDLVVDDAAPHGGGAGQRPGTGTRAPRARRGAAAGDVHARLRHHELLRRRLRRRGDALPAPHHGARASRSWA